MPCCLLEKCENGTILIYININTEKEFYFFVSHFAYYKIYTGILFLSSHYEKQKSRIQSLNTCITTVSPPPCHLSYSLTSPPGGWPPPHRTRGFRWHTDPAGIWSKPSRVSGLLSFGSRLSQLRHLKSEKWRDYNNRVRLVGTQSQQTFSPGRAACRIFYHLNLVYHSYVV